MNKIKILAVTLALIGATLSLTSSAHASIIWSDCFASDFDFWSLFF